MSVARKISSLRPPQHRRPRDGRYRRADHFGRVDQPVHMNRVEPDLSSQPIELTALRQWINVHVLLSPTTSVAASIHVDELLAGHRRVVAQLAGHQVTEELVRRQVPDLVVVIGQLVDLAHAVHRITCSKRS